MNTLMPLAMACLIAESWFSGTQSGTRIADGFWDMAVSVLPERPRPSGRRVWVGSMCWVAPSCDAGRGRERGQACLGTGWCDGGRGRTAPRLYVRGRSRPRGEDLRGVLGTDAVHPLHL